jgi:hypothetical protein
MTEPPRLLDWSHTGSVGPPQPCRICGRAALMRDPDGQPCHKTCAETCEWQHWQDRTDLPHTRRAHRLAA